MREGGRAREREREGNCCKRPTKEKRVPHERLSMREWKRGASLINLNPYNCVSLTIDSEVVVVIADHNRWNSFNNESRNKRASVKHREWN